MQPGAGFTAVTISFKEFGVRLQFTPVIMPNGNIHLKVAPEVSTLDFANALTISGFTVPALSTRKAETEFELQDGQSFVIAGLMDNRVTDIYNKIPGLGDIPILGNFFRSKSLQKSNSELMVLCTVRRISPNTEQPAPPKNPKPFLDHGQVRQEKVVQQIGEVSETRERNRISYGIGNRRVVMPELSVVIVATDNEQRAVLQVLVDGTSVARTVHTCASFPVAASDPVTPARARRQSRRDPGRYSGRQSRSGSASHRTSASGDARRRHFCHRQSEPASDHRQCHAGRSPRIH